MYQKLTIVGNLGRDPEMRYLPSGQAVTDLSVATNRVYMDSNNQKVTETSWFRVSVWGGRAETVNQYLRKGSRVLIDGYLRPDPETGGPRIWMRNDGTPAASFEMTGTNVTFLSSKQEDEARGGGAGYHYPEATVDEDDIPF